MTTDREESHKEYVSLRDYFDTRLDAIEKATEVAIVASQRAVEKAEIANNARFANVNEFRQALTDQTREYLPRAEFNIQFKSINDKVDNIIRAYTDTTKIGEGKTQGINLLGHLVYGLIVAAGVVVAMLTFFRH